MIKIKNILNIFILTAVLAIASTGCVLPKFNEQITSHQIIERVNMLKKPPKEVYLSAWSAVKDLYVDKSYNHQDWSRWKNKYENDIKTYDDAYVAIDSMLESLNDPYTRFLKPSDFAEQDRGIDAKLYGIGVHISDKKGNTYIVDVISGTPAQKRGLKANDIIMKVNGTPVSGIGTSKVADLVRGKEGSFVQLTIKRGDKTIVKKVERAKIDVKSVEYKIIDKKIAYIKISSFLSNKTADEMATALKKTKDAKGIIVDLRGNFGGLLPNAVYIADMFINKGTIVSIVDRDGDKEVINASPYEVYTNKPLVVLINGASASASEILSGALKDNKRATLIGETSFGKGLVQEIHPLSNGAGINITIAKYLTPNGSDINKKGIKPNINIPFSIADFLRNKDPQLDKAKKVIAAKIN